MPQMAPLNWLFLFFYFIIMIIFIISFIYFICLMKSNLMVSKKSMSNMTWMW
uniref:ATP synthetase subunit 8 n=1 Tax=Tettigettalna defauti TaxID=1366431 RepID=A0A482KFH8_9HEMI|nr:ATP synthetase subunit 8 [Tettigettalna defauti]QBQ02039.1 ATP synthetase subunit 8 [Tettigettalna defauti]QBQ02043.1 ATP synthetase subunit 8 [Tettigettalna defauti]